MKKELLDKPVVCIYDIRAIQKYIFNNTVNLDIMGASVVIIRILKDALLYALKNNSMKLQDDEFCLQELEDPDHIPYFTDERIKAQIITIGGGNAFMIYRTGRICEAVSREFSRYILENTYSLQVAIAAVEMTDSIYDDINRLYPELDIVKNTDSVAHPMGTLPIVKREAMTGNAVAYIDADTGEELSMETYIKRKEAGLSPSIFERAECFDTMKKYNERLAYIHMDGNSMGLTIGKIMSTRKSYEEGIRARRYLNRNIVENYIHALYEVEKWLFERMTKDGIPEEQLHYYYQRIHAGGDDVNLVMSYRYALDFVEKFLDTVSGRVLWSDSEIGTINFSVCAGIGFVSSEVSYRDGIRLAEECCDEAKSEAKKPENLIDGQVGNWIDFQINDNAIVDSVTNVREKSYTSLGNVSLCLRPYCLDEERKDTPTYYGKLKQYMDIFRNQIRNERVILDLTGAYSGTSGDVQLFLSNYKVMGGIIPEELGTPYKKVTARKQTCASWYDALEIVQYFNKRGE